MSAGLVYLDHAASSPLRPRVAAAMDEARAGALGNPTGSHPAAQRARRLLEEARDEVATFLGRDPAEMVFCSGGTEAANLAVLGTLGAARRAGGPATVLVSAVEHPAVRESVRLAQEAGVTAGQLPVGPDGVLDLDALSGALTAQTTVVAVMTANNETGVVQPVPEVVAAVRHQAPQAVVFTDAVQAGPWLDLADVAAGADLVSLSAHKLGGPVGVGVLAVHPRVGLVARQVGGGQERERRSGTPDVVGAVGLAAAVRMAGAERTAVGARVAGLRDRLRRGLLAAVPGLVLTVPDGVAVLPGHLHLCVPGAEREELLVALGREGVCVSGGSSCASGALEPSHVLAAMGVERRVADGALRFSLGPSTTEADVGRALEVVPAVVERLRRAV